MVNKFLIVFLLLFTLGCAPARDTRYKVSYYNSSGQFVKSEIVMLPKNVQTNIKHRTGNIVVSNNMCEYVIAPMGWNLELEEIK